MSELWRIAPGQQLASWSWDDEVVVYNNLSGDTHLLDGDSMALLERLHASAASIGDLVTTFSVDLDPDDARALPATLTALLATLGGLFLVESLSSSSC